MRLVFGSDHAGYDLREQLAAWARERGYEVETVGADSREAYDYPDAADEVVEQLLHNHVPYGVLICGTGIGVCIRANRYPQVRAATCCSTEMARMARLHNHANVLCLGGRTTPFEDAAAILDVFLSTGEDEDERHRRRVLKLGRTVQPC